MTCVPNANPLPSTELNKYIECYLFMDMLSTNVYSSYDRGVNHLREMLSGRWNNIIIIPSNG